MTDSRPSRAGTSTRGLWTLICLLLAPAVFLAAHWEWRTDRWR